MNRHSFKIVHHAGNVGFFPSRFNTLLAYALIIFFVRFGDAIMSYFSPNYIQAATNPLLTGFIMASSSMCGITCDFLFGKWFAHRSYRFFLTWGITLALLFPLIFLLLPAHALTFILGMIVWGIYCEMLSFSNFNFINHTMSHNHHDTGWSVLQTFVALAYMLAPLVASFLVGLSFKLTLLVAFLFIIIGAIGYQVFTRQHVKSVATIEKPSYQLTTIETLRLWLLLGRRLWPILLFVFVIWMLDAVFWNAGSILAEQLTEKGILGGLLFLAYLAPALFMGFVANRISRYAGKKRTAYLAGICAGTFFICAGIVNQPFILFGLIALASTFIAIAIPEVNGTIEDYLERLGHSANYLISLDSAATSMSYIIGPILTGITATYFSYQFSFSMIGILIVIASLVALIATPRKIHLPQHRIRKIVNH